MTREADLEFTPSRMVQELAARSRRPVTRPGPELISLAAGDPDFATPEHISQALADAVAGGATHYAQPQGDPELRTALADQVADGEVSFVRHRPDLHLDLDGIAAAAPGARMVVICNPCNPTGAVYTRDELDELADIAEQNNLLVLSDEAYDHIVYDGVEFTSALEIEGLRERLIYVQTFSKTYAMTGWRIGYRAGPKAVVEAATRVHRAFNGPLGSAIQRAALVAVTEPTDWPARMCREYEARRDIVTRMVNGVAGLELCEPEGSFYAFIRYPAEASSLDVVRQAAEQGVAVRPGIEFGPGGEGHVRVAFSTGRELLIEGMERLLGVLEELG